MMDHLNGVSLGADDGPLLVVFGSSNLLKKFSKLTPSDKTFWMRAWMLPLSPAMCYLSPALHFDMQHRIFLVNLIFACLLNPQRPRSYILLASCSTLYVLLLVIVARNIFDKNRLLIIFIPCPTHLKGKFTLF